MELDFPKAIENCNYSADFLDRDAQLEDALSFESGTGVENEIAIAAMYFRLTANDGRRDIQMKSYNNCTKGRGDQNIVFHPLKR